MPRSCHRNTGGVAHVGSLRISPGGKDSLVPEQETDRQQAGQQEVGGREVVVYTRPGCPFCTSLRAGLRRHGLEYRDVDIWEEPSAAETVRFIADGSETVPTVVIGDWNAVNPSPAEVLAAVGEHAPELLSDHQPGVVEGTLNALGLRRRKS